MSLYKRKPTPPIEAVQFTDPNNPPPGVQQGLAEGHFYVVALQGKRIEVSVGEWIVTEQSAPDRHYPIAHHEFQRLYEPET